MRDDLYPVFTAKLGPSRRPRGMWNLDNEIKGGDCNFKECEGQEQVRTGYKESLLAATSLLDSRSERESTTMVRVVIAEIETRLGGWPATSRLE